MDDWDVGRSEDWVAIFTTLDSACPAVERILWETVWDAIRDPLEGCVLWALGDTVEESIKEIM